MDETARSQHSTNGTQDNETPQIAHDSVEDNLTLTVHHQGRTHTYNFPKTSTLSDLSSHITTDLNIPESSQKFLISPKPGLLKPPFSSSTTTGSIPLKSILPIPSNPRSKITLLGSTQADQEKLDKTISESSQRLHTNPTSRNYTGPLKPATPYRSKASGSNSNIKTLNSSITHTFHRIEPLSYLPNPSKSHRFLERLANDPGIKTAMAKHSFSVGLLTEMNPAEHTTQHGKTLGLNRNGGEIIELRLRTDAYDGYRDYKTIRRTLCHELAHNVHGEHDRKFWDLCKEIERDVEKGDWTRGGHRLGNEEFYNPDDGGEDAVHDHGAWTGGSFVLGTSEGSVGGGVGGTTANVGSSPAVGSSRREMMAKAAEERMKKQREEQGGGK